VKITTSTVTEGRSYWSMLYFSAMVVDVILIWVRLQTVGFFLKTLQVFKTDKV